MPFFATSPQCMNLWNAQNLLRYKKQFFKISARTGKQLPSSETVKSRYAVPIIWLIRITEIQRLEHDWVVFLGVLKASSLLLIHLDYIILKYVKSEAKRENWKKCKSVYLRNKGLSIPAPSREPWEFHRRWCASRQRENAGWWQAPPPCARTLILVLKFKGQH